MNLLEHFADPASWSEVGYQPFPLGDPRDRPPATRPAAVPLGAVEGRYDVVIVGAGAGGGVAARVLTDAGASVLVIERGTWIDRDARSIDHLTNHRLTVRGDGTTPAGHPRAVRRDDGSERIVDARDPRYRNNAIAVGGGSRFFGAQAWRFHPDDFRMASKYGVPAGSAVADWPISYDDLEPFYDLVEWELGVAGAASPSAPWPRRRGYPMEPLPPSTEAVVLGRAADVLGWPTMPVPLLVNTVARDGRPACVRCGFCVGFPCPVDAKNGSDVTTLAHATARGAHLVTSAQVVRVDDDPDEEHDLAGTRVERDMLDLLRTALDDVAAPDDQYARLGLQ